MEAPLQRSQVLRQAWPLILASATTPLLGLVDTAAIGHGGSAVDLASIALGSLLFSFIYWSFGFLRMSTTAFAAQAAGASDVTSLTLSLTRPLLLGVLIGLVLLALRVPIELGAFGLLGGGPLEEAGAASYFRARLWGAPFALSGFAATGFLIGTGCSKEVLWLQLATNGINIALDVFFVFVLSWGAEGIGIGTAIAESSGALLGVFLCVGVLKERGATKPSISELLDAKQLRRAFSANADIMIRTLAMISAFAFFTDQAARAGVVVLAANHILLQFISFSAFFLDGFAHVAEAQVGHALGAKSKVPFFRALRLTAEWSATFAFILASAVFFGGAWGISLLTDLASVREAAAQYLLPTSGYVLVSFVAFQMDGVFIGAAFTRRMRDASLLCAGSFWLLGHFFVDAWGNTGLWWAFVSYVALRGVSLVLFLPSCIRGLEWSDAESKDEPL